MIVQCGLQAVLAALEEVPELSRLPDYPEVRSRVGKDFLALLWLEGDIPVGAKLGYRLSEDVFYSWLGGVQSAFRGRGIAQELLRAQEDWCRKQGYSYLRVKSMNRFPGMLSLLIRNRYQVTHVEGGNVEGDSTALGQLKIGFQKQLGLPADREEASDSYSAG